MALPQTTPTVNRYAPTPPATRVSPTRVASDTWVVHQVQHALDAPLCVYINSMVIAGSEPVVVDTGCVNNREQWLNDVFSIVEPEDVRWVFLSHDDADHTGNLAQVLDACPNATLMYSWALHERFSNAFRFPLQRCRWLNAGEVLDVGDRRLVAVRPPVYDSPATRGLFDERTGVLWGVDAFAAPCPGEPVATVADLDGEFWAGGMAMFTYNALSPWLGLVDPARFAAEVDAVQALPLTAVATAHSPLIEAGSLDAAFALLRALPSVAAPPAPGQPALDDFLATTG